MPEMTPEMAKMATEMMGKMKPEDIEQMQKMASTMGMGSGGGGGGGMMPPAGAMDMMKDPKFMESAMGMMRAMDESSLASLMAAQGMSQEQAQAAAKQMKGMSESQMKMMVKAGAVIQTGAQFAVKAKEFLLSRTMLVIALVLILVGIFLQNYYSLVLL